MHCAASARRGADRARPLARTTQLGRYWTIEQGGKPVQRYYYIPRGLIEDTNLLVFIDELGGASVGGVQLVLATAVVPATAAAV